MSSAFHHESDGQTERVNRTLERTLRMFVSPAQDDWDDLIPAFKFACNSHMPTAAAVMLRFKWARRCS